MNSIGSKRGDHPKVPHRNRRGFSRMSLSASLLNLTFVAFPSPPAAMILSYRRACFRRRVHHERPHEPGQLPHHGHPHPSHRYAPLRQSPELVMEPCQAAKRDLAQWAGDSLKSLEQPFAWADRGMGALDRFNQDVAQMAVASLGDPSPSDSLSAG